jgi:hypothetical protein
MGASPLNSLILSTHLIFLCREIGYTLCREIAVTYDFLHAIVLVYAQYEL